MCLTGRIGCISVLSGEDRMYLGSMRKEYLNRIVFVRHIRFKYSYGVLCAELFVLGSLYLALGT